MKKGAEDGTRSHQKTFVQQNKEEVRSREASASGGNRPVVKVRGVNGEPEPDEVRMLRVEKRENGMKGGKQFRVPEKRNKGERHSEPRKESIGSEPV